MRRRLIAPRRRARTSLRPRMEGMEARLLLATITVNTTADADVRDTALSLREAIEVANGDLAVANLSAEEQAQVAGAVTSPAPDTIAFNIPGTEVKTIVPQSNLPTITEPVVIDGYTQPGSSPNTNPVTTGINAVPRIQLSSVLADSGIGLLITAGGSTVRGLVINGFQYGIRLETNGGNTIAGNFVGTDPSGTTAARNLGNISLFSSPNNTIGGPDPGDRNLISGSTGPGIGASLDWSGLVIQGNFIGTDVTGTKALGNQDGVNLFGSQTGTGSSATIGGTAAGARNLISGNTFGSGIDMQFSEGSVIQGNFIGTDVTGTTKLGNNVALAVNLGRGNTIGGTAVGAGNVLAGSFGVALQLTSPENLIQGNFIGTDVTGTIPLGNTGGAIAVSAAFSALNNTIGGTAANAGNTIAFNAKGGFTAQGGILVGGGVTGTMILGNSIFSNNGQGISTSAPAAPTLTGATGTSIAGTLSGPAGTTFRVEFFATPNERDQGKTFLGATDVTTDGAGTASFTFSRPGGIPAGDLLTATATSTIGTSVFSQAISVQVAAASATTVTSSPNPSSVGQSVTFTATVTGQAQSSLTGNVIFREGTSILLTVPLVVDASGTGVATFSTTSLAAGSHAIMADYSGDAAFAPSSGSTTQVVQGSTQVAQTTTAVVAAPPTSTAGESVTFTATVSGTGGASATPTGSITFREGTTVLKVVPLGDDRRAAFSTAALAAGSHAVTADYSGDAAFGPSSGSTAEVVRAIASLARTTTTVVAAPPASTAGQPVTFTATVSAGTGTSGTPTGSVTFREGTTVLKVVPLGDDRRAAFSTAALAPGAHNIAADYSGDALFASSSGSASEAVRSIRRLGTTTAAIAAPNPSTVGRLVSFTATVTCPSAGAGTPTGSVTFREGATVLRVVRLGSNRQAAFSTASLAPGVHTITASYGGDGKFAPSRGSASQRVNIVVPPGDGDGPTVANVERFGFHWMPTTLVLTFNEALDPSRAQDPSNYTILAPSGRLILVGSAIYDPVAHRVVLHPLERLDLHRKYMLVVNGSGTGAVSDRFGRPLNSRRLGRSGSDFVTVLDARALVITGPIPTVAAVRLG